MKLSVRGRYALLSTTYLATQYSSDTYVPVQEISQKFSISKIYLEQVFTLLKTAGLVVSVKGQMGGYKLSKPAKEITVFDILKTTESNLIEKTEATTMQPSIYEDTFSKLVYEPLDAVIQTTLNSVTLEDLSTSLQQDNFMFYI